MTDSRLFTIATGSPEPIYRQLVEQVRRRVAAGQWTAGMALPSVRELAQVLVVNPMTVSKAYSLLEAEGLLERQRGVGMAIAAEHARARQVGDRVDLLRPVLERAAIQARELGVSPAQALGLWKQILEEGS